MPSILSSSERLFRASFTLHNERMTSIAETLRRRMPLAVLGLLLGGLLVVIAAWAMLARWRLSECHQRYALLNPLRRCSHVVDAKKEYETFRDELVAWTDGAQKARKFSHLSVYFRDLEGGPWFGIREDEHFSAASLLKVPIMMTALREAESNPSFLRQELGYSGSFEDVENVLDPSKTILQGRYYTVEELLRRMIVYSDNNSKELLKSRLLSLGAANDPIAQTYRNLGIFNESDTLDLPITVKVYSSIFRSLYNASYLGKDMSQKALDLLSRVEFRDGLVASLPTTVTVAHKFGVRSHGKEQQLHDCGIVYHPKAPYLLCVMTRGNDLTVLADAIRDVSRMVYEEVDRRG